MIHVGQKKGSTEKFAWGVLFQNESKNTLESFLNYLYAISALTEMKMCRHFYNENSVKSA